MRFDWYQATVETEPIHLAVTIKRRLGGQGGFIEYGKGRYNYHHSCTVKTGEGHRLAVILHGGPNGAPNLTTSGDVTPEVVELFREEHPRHRVTRLDACEDFIGSNSWDKLESVCRATTAAHRVKGVAFVPDDLKDGRTYRMGGMSSDVTAKLYEKTCQMRGQLHESQWGTIPDDWNRLEAVVRPKDWRVKEFVATITPEQVWGFSGWTADLAKRALELDVERLSTRIKKQSSDDRALTAMASQYANVLMRLEDDLGGWDLVGIELGQLIAKLRGE